MDNQRIRKVMAVKGRQEKLGVRASGMAWVMGYFWFGTCIEVKKWRELGAGLVCIAFST